MKKPSKITNMLGIRAGGPRNAKPSTPASRYVAPSVQKAKNAFSSKTKKR